MKELIKDPDAFLKGLGLNLAPQELLNWYLGYVSEKGAAELTGYSVAWFQRARWSGKRGSGKGPTAFKVGGRIKYRRSDLIEWMNSEKND